MRDLKSQCMKMFQENQKMQMAQTAPLLTGFVKFINNS